jgi:hypothetical protein
MVNMFGTYDTLREKDTCMKFWFEKLKTRDHLRDQGVDEREVLILILKKLIVKV